MRASELPAARRFLGSYFHQDLGADTRCIAGAVADYRGRVGADGCRQVAAELTSVLRGAAQEAAVVEFLDEAGVEVDVHRLAGSARTWLERVVSALAG